MKFASKVTKLLSVLLPAFCCGVSFASNPWTFEIAPYIWGVNMNGSVGVGPARAHVDQSIGNLLKQLNFAAMLYATAHKDDFGLYFNGIYSVTSDSLSTTDFNVKEKNRFGIYGAGLSYIVFQRDFLYQRKIALEPYLGARYTVNNTTVNVNQFSFKKDVNWTDPVVGFRLNYHFTRSWLALLTGDIGGINGSTHYSYSASALIGYQASSPSLSFLSTYLGYHILDQHYQTGNGANFYNWNMKLFGPVLGVMFTF